MAVISATLVLPFFICALRLLRLEGDAKRLEYHQYSFSPRSWVDDDFSAVTVTELHVFSRSDGKHQTEMLAAVLRSAILMTTIFATNYLVTVTAISFVCSITICMLFLIKPLYERKRVNEMRTSFDIGVVWLNGLSLAVAASGERKMNLAPTLMTLGTPVIVGLAWLSLHYLQKCIPSRLWTLDLQPTSQRRKSSIITSTSDDVAAVVARRASIVSGIPQFPSSNVESLRESSDKANPTPNPRALSNSLIATRLSIAHRPVSSRVSLVPHVPAADASTHKAFASSSKGVTSAPLREVSAGRLQSSSVELTSNGNVNVPPSSPPTPQEPPVMSEAVVIHVHDPIKKCSKEGSKDESLPIQLDDFKINDGVHLRLHSPKRVRPELQVVHL